MTGASVIGELLRADVAIATMVDTASIKAGRLADNASLPTLLVRTVSSVEWQSLAREDTTPTFDRVAVTVRAGSYREQVAIMKLVRRACAGRVGTIAGLRNVAILTAGVGPDVNGPADSFEQTQDFRVSFDAPA